MSLEAVYWMIKFWLALLLLGIVIKCLLEVTWRNVSKLISVFLWRRISEVTLVRFFWRYIADSVLKKCSYGIFVYSRLWFCFCWFIKNKDQRTWCWAVCSYRIYDDEIVEPGMLGSTAINRCVALSEFDVSDAHITNHSTSPAAAAAAGVASPDHSQTDQSVVCIVTVACIRICRVMCCCLKQSCHFPERSPEIQVCQGLNEVLCSSWIKLSIEKLTHNVLKKSEVFVWSSEHLPSGCVIADYMSSKQCKIHTFQKDGWFEVKNVRSLCSKDSTCREH